MRVLTAVIVIWKLVAPVAAQTLSPAPLTIEAAIERAMTANPSIAAARLRRVATLTAIDVARERLNPEVRVELEREAPTQAYSLAIPIETGGKRARRLAVGHAAVNVKDAELARTTLDVRTSVRRAYFGRHVAESRLALLQEMETLAVRARDVAQQRFDAGSAPRLEVLQAELARSDAANQAGAAQGAANAARVQLNALLALPPGTPVSLETPLDVGLAPPATGSAERAASASAEVAVFDRLLDEQRARVALASALRVPDVTPEATITRGSEPEFNTGWRLGVSVAVPLFTRNRAGVRLEEATLTHLAAERDAVAARITGEAAAALAIADAQRQLYLRYRDEIVPQATQIELLAEDSYRLGRTGIAAYLQALQASRDVRLRTLQSASDFHAALADLELIIGAPVP